MATGQPGIMTLCPWVRHLTLVFLGGGTLYGAEDKHRTVSDYNGAYRKKMNKNKQWTCGTDSINECE